MRKTGILSKVNKDLKANKVEFIVFDKVEPNPRASTIDEASRIARAEKADLIIGLGGGSTMDAAKGIALASCGTKPIWHYVENQEKLKATALPLILVPSVAASGSEANDGAVITNWDTHDKKVIMHPLLFPKVSIIDPELTISLPEKPTRQGGVDIFCHLAECYITAENPSPLSDGIMEASMRMVAESLPQILANPKDIKARTTLSWASTVACSQFTNLGGGAGVMTLHGIEHPLSGYYDIAHGDGLAALLTAWMEYTIAVRKERFNSLAKNVFYAKDGISATVKWLKKIGMDLNLRSLGVEQARFEELAKCAVTTAPWLKYHPNRLNVKIIKKLYQAAY